MISTAPGLRKIGFVYHGSADGEFDQWRPQFLEALKELTWIEGHNLIIDWRFADFDQTRYAPLVADLIRAGEDVLLTAGTPLTRVLKESTNTVPIVTGVGDPVGSGFAMTLAKPGGNITGLSWALREKARKQIELLLEMVPSVRTLLILRSAQYGDISELNRCLETVAREFGMNAEARTIQSFDGVEATLNDVAGDKTVAAFVYGHGSLQVDTSRFVESAIRHRVATVSDDRLFVDAGGLMSYTLNHPDQARSWGSLINQILHGTSPAEIPFELPTKADFVINQRTATLLGIVIPPDLLQHADAVII